ncbi:DNA primase large subunit [Smittium mucronatum]|uniref:DNA primase large subunit n=1 Tax=Smittium mucronatum TaxID=133383 RepID=A0A1R0H0Q6_9FUNG|nr:DNA primase large subunit [Smittium mucronatum]
MYSQTKRKNVVISNTNLATHQNILDSPYPSRLSLYDQPPDLEVSIEEFENFALDRLKVLKEVELAAIRGPTVEASQKKIIEVANKYFPLSSRKLKNYGDLMNERRKDHVSHFILRLSFSRTRRVYIRDGFAYVPVLELSVLLVDDFKKRLTEATAICSRALPRLVGDDRILPVLQNMSAQYSSSEYQSSGVAGEITSSDVDKLSKYFPPCMLNLHLKLRENSHLKHGARMQYGLFLKGIGLKLPEALIFWKHSFSKQTSDAKFEKEYAYNIRHNYGMEGRRVDYTPYSCSKIIKGSNPGPSDFHGCPFKHFNSNHLLSFLTAASTSTSTDAESKISEIVSLAKQQHYQVACTRFLELQINDRLAKSRTNPDPASNSAISPLPSKVTVEGVSHPNTYFDLNLSNGSVESSK